MVHSGEIEHRHRHVFYSERLAHIDDAELERLIDRHRRAFGMADEPRQLVDITPKAKRD